MCEDLKIYVYRRKESLLEVVPATLRHPHVVPTNLTRNLAMSRTLGTRSYGSEFRVCSVWKTQRLQNPLIKEYTLNYNSIP